MEKTPSVAIIYICYNVLKYAPEAVSSVAMQSYPKDRTQLVFIPNGSPDGIDEYIRTKVMPRAGVDLPRVISLNDRKNRGFTGGNNVGMLWAIQKGFDYVFLLNGDAKLHKDAIKEAIELAESSKEIGSVQSKVVLWGDHETLNTTGGVVHMAGYGYARHNGVGLDEATIENGEEISYASGAAALYKVSILKDIGLLDEGFFMYHEDLELGLRIKFVGFKNVLATESIVYHDYEFGRNKTMFEWMELYRWMVMMAYAKWPTIILLAPIWIAIDSFGFIAALSGGWLPAKWRGTTSRLKAKNLAITWRMRKRAQSIRKIKDKEWLWLVSGRIDGQESLSIFIRASNIIVDTIWRALRTLIIW